MAWLPWLEDGEDPTLEWIAQLYTTAEERFTAVGGAIDATWHQPFLDTDLLTIPRIRYTLPDDATIYTKLLSQALIDLAPHYNRVDPDGTPHHLAYGGPSDVEATKLSSISRLTLGHATGAAHVPFSPFPTTPVVSSRAWNNLRRMVQCLRYRRHTTTHNIGAQQVGSGTTWADAKTDWIAASPASPSSSAMFIQGRSLGATSFDINAFDQLYDLTIGPTFDLTGRAFLFKMDVGQTEHLDGGTDPPTPIVPWTFTLGGLTAEHTFGTTFGSIERVAFDGTLPTGATTLRIRPRAYDNNADLDLLEPPVRTRRYSSLSGDAGGSAGIDVLKFLLTEPDFTLAYEDVAPDYSA